jgi:hypothetical protein
VGTLCALGTLCAVGTLCAMITSVCWDTLCVQGALAFTQVAAGTVVTVDTSAAVSMPGVVRVLTKGDIPPGASNEIGAIVLQETLFLGAGDEVKCVTRGHDTWSWRSSPFACAPVVSPACVALHSHSPRCFFAHV